MDTLMPHFALMHEMTTQHVHEEIQLLANNFSTMLMETFADVPRWSAYYWSRDQTSSYEYLRTRLQALQFLRGGRRWVLKSPQHLGQLACVRQRDTIPTERSVDIRFDEFMAGEVDTAERLFTLAAEPFDGPVRGAIADHLEGHRRGRLGRVATSAQMFGLDEDELRERFASYTQRFLG